MALETMMGGGGHSKLVKDNEFIASGGPEDDPLTRNLKKLYDEVAAEPIPDDWMRLLEEMDVKTAAGPDGAAPKRTDAADG